MPVHGNFLLSRVELIKDHASILNLPILQLLLSDARVVLIIVKQSLLDGDFDAGGHKVQVLVESVPHFGVFMHAHAHLANAVVRSLG